MENLVIKNHKWMDVIVLINGKNNVYAISRKSNITHGHCVRLTNEFERIGWAKSVKVGRSKLFKLSKRGSELLQHVLVVQQAISDAYKG